MRVGIASGVALALLVTSSATASGHGEHAKPERRSFTLAATGDVLTEGPVVNRARADASGGVRFDFGPMFAPVAPIISAADLAICHMEVPIGAPAESPGTKGRSEHGGNLLLAPYEIAGDLAATGFDRCSTASNHSNDLGAAGIASTLQAFDDAGVSHVGTARTERESGVGTFVVNGVRVAHLAFTTSTNTALITSGWGVHYARDAARVASWVRVARLLGAEVVVLSIHVGQELGPAPSAGDRRFVEAITAFSDVDLIVEHGPHVIQPLEQVNGTWVFWSVGNFVSAMGTAPTGRYSDARTLDGLIATATFTETSGGHFEVSPSAVLICNQRSDRTVRPVEATLADPATSAPLRREMEQCAARSEGALASVP